MREKSSDNAWIMVEDEFLSTAQTFTQHLHHAEYKRLQDESAKRSTKDILRPIDWRTPVIRELLIKDKRRGAELKRSSTLKKAGLAANLDDEDEDIDIADRNLAELMLGKQRARDSMPKPVLTNICDSTKPRMRASAGQVPERQAESKSLSGYNATIHGSDIDEDDLDKNSSAANVPSVRRQHGQRPAQPTPPTVSRLPTMTELRYQTLDRANTSIRPVSGASHTIGRSRSRSRSHLRAKASSDQPPAAVLGDSLFTSNVKCEPLPVMEPFVDELMPKMRSAAAMALLTRKSGKQIGPVAEGASERDAAKLSSGQSARREQRQDKRHSIKLEEIPTFLF